MRSFSPYPIVPSDEEKNCPVKTAATTSVTVLTSSAQYLGPLPLGNSAPTTAPIAGITRSISSKLFSIDLSYSLSLVLRGEGGERGESSHIKKIIANITAT